MIEGPDADPLYLERICELAQLIRSGLRGWSQDRFVADRDKSDVTAYRLSVVGELSRKLSADLKERHTVVDWAGMYRLRNIVAHHYHRLDYGLIWDIATSALDDLEAACRAELGRTVE